MKERKFDWNILILSACFIIGMSATCFIANNEHLRLIEQKKNTDNEARQKIEYKNSLDSARAENIKLSTYKTLTESMSARDLALKGLLKVGDIAYMKNDSSRVVIIDRLIGGGNYNYYIEYKILYHDGKTAEVSPELIFKK